LLRRNESGIERIKSGLYLNLLIYIAQTLEIIVSIARNGFIYNRKYNETIIILLPIILSIIIFVILGKFLISYIESVPWYGIGIIFSNIFIKIYSTKHI